ncbi:hypothetical protein CGZ93_16820 [Enemella dayhoffiae]|uniref:Uncharacterized protein n=1 Tax=Enemella dayhoffiae TaxID=2016507 RepID=A0A255GP95_9ACTN|nr:hypothetical protein [Enemella dayhoffiae]OYO17232.1 hypothetical protein CGZ93_16820 [Enemella dayhoffiae]
MRTKLPALAALLLLAGCSAQGTPATPSAPAPLPEASAPATSSAPAATPSGTPQPSRGPSAAASTGSRAATPTSGRSGTPSGGAAPAGPVDPEGYRVDRAYYFKSPSGNIFCAIQPRSDVQTVGCQSDQVIPTLPKCNKPDSLAPGAWFGSDDNSPVHKDCVNQGFFIGQNPKVLGYGQVLTVGRYRCESRTTEVRCGVDGTDRGFRISKERIDTSG